MAITQSIIVSQSPQQDGTTLVHERHTFHTGETSDVTYYAQPGANIENIMDARVQVLEEAMKQADLHRCVFTEPWDYVMQHATNADLAPFVRELYRESIKTQTVLIGMRMVEWVQNGRFTQTQMRNAFGMNSTQWTTLTNKILALIDQFNAIEAATGE